MNPEQFFTLVGLTNTDAVLVDAIQANGASIEDLSPKKLKELTTDFVQFKQLGVVLAFTPKGFFESHHGMDPRGNGPYALDGVIYYPNGSASLSAYLSTLPFASGPVNTRDQALAAFGEPQETEEDDGDIDWDIWKRDDLQVHVDYKSDLSVKTVTYSFPMKD